MIRAYAAVVLMMLGLALAGCKGPEEGTTYMSGNFGGVLTTSLPQALEATIDALEDLKMTVNHKEIDPDQTEAKVVARSDQNVRCAVELYAAGEGSTKVNIRVGLSGDRDYSHALFRKIRSKI